jgi:transcriptional regulator with XRE-family HTH domain
MVKERFSMSEAPRTVVKDIPPDDLPLSVLLFNAAMNQKIALSKFAQELGIGALSLRQFISGQTQRPRSRTLEILAKALGMSVEEVRRRASLQPTAAPRFAEWLKAQMDAGFSRAKLTRETRISDGALRNYLAGQTLPDSDQAQKLAEILEVEPLELAKVLVADQTIRSGGETVPVIESSDDAEGDIDMAPGAANGIYGETQEQRARAFPASASEEERLLMLWRQLHPQGRRATLNYIASLIAEG